MHGIYRNSFINSAISQDLDIKRFYDAFQNHFA